MKVSHTTQEVTSENFNQPGLFWLALWWVHAKQGKCSFIAKEQDKVRGM